MYYHYDCRKYFLGPVVRWSWPGLQYKSANAREIIVDSMYVHYWQDHLQSIWRPSAIWMLSNLHGQTFCYVHNDTRYTYKSIKLKSLKLFRLFIQFVACTRIARLLPSEVKAPIDSSAAFALLLFFHFSTTRPISSGLFLFILVWISCKPLTSWCSSAHKAPPAIAGRLLKAEYCLN